MENVKNKYLTGKNPGKHLHLSTFAAYFLISDSIFIVFLLYAFFYAFTQVSVVTAGKCELNICLSIKLNITGRTLKEEFYVYSLNDVLMTLLQVMLKRLQ